MHSKSAQKAQSKLQNLSPDFRGKKYLEASVTDCSEHDVNTCNVIKLTPSKNWSTRDDISCDGSCQKTTKRDQKR